jgi:hypothetical protein
LNFPYLLVLGTYKSSLQYPKNCFRQNENSFLVEEELSEFTKLKYFAYI